MFSSNKGKGDAGMPLNIGPAPIPPKRTLSRTGSVPSIVSADLTVTGTLNTSGDMQIDGILEGDVRSAGLVIGERGLVRGGRWLRQSGAGQCAQEARNECQRRGSGCEAAWAGRWCGGALHAPRP